MSQLRKGANAKCRSCIQQQQQLLQQQESTATKRKRKKREEEIAALNKRRKEMKEAEELKYQQQKQQRQQDEAGLTKVNVEFKFTNYKTAAFREGDVSGVLHVPMFQDPTTGRFKVRRGWKNKVVFKVKRVHQMIKKSKSVWRDPDRFYDKVFPEEKVAGVIYCDYDGDIHDFRLDYRLGWTTENTNEFVYCLKPDKFDIHSYNSTKDDQDEVELKEWYRYNFGLYSDHTFSSIPMIGNSSPHNEEFYRHRLKEWETNAGGILTFFTMLEYDDYSEPPFNVEFYAEDTDQEEEFQNSWSEAYERATTEADYKLKLYTVLSAHRPSIEQTDDDEKKPAASNVGPVEEKKPAAASPAADANDEAENDKNWGGELVRQVMARLDKDEAWSKRAVGEYKHFLQLKIDHDDYESKLFSPSAKIDEIWHAHLSFTDRYQRDVRALSKNNKIIEHMPVLGEEPYKRYAAAYNAHKIQMKEQGSKVVDGEFWPHPNSIPQPKPSTGGDSSGDELTYEEPEDPHPSCGWPMRY